jgi:ATP-binding cassette subfamily C protein
VALRGEWWKSDSGPLLAYRAGYSDAVALLPKGGTAYELVGPRSIQRTIVNAEIAATLEPIAIMFYPSLPGIATRLRDLARFGLQRSRKEIWTIVAMGVLVGLLGMVTPYFTGYIFDQLIPSADRPQLMTFTVGLIVAAVGMFAFELVRAISVLRLEGQVNSIAQAGVVSRLLDLPSIFFRQYTAGDLADRALGIEQIRQIISQTGTTALVGSVSIVIMFFFLFTYDWKMALAATAPLALSVLLPIIANLFQLRLQRKLFYLRGNISGLLLQLLNGINKLKVTGAEDRVFRQWSVRFSRQKRLAFRAGRITNTIQIYNQVIPLLCSAFVFGIYAYFKYEAAKNNTPFKMTTGQFVAFNTTFTLILASLLQLSTSSLDLMMIVPVAERLRPILDSVPEIDASKAHPGELTGEIELWHVTFRYLKDGPAILKDVSFRVSPGEYVALVGGSGSGKSTLLRVLLGFEKPEAGSVFYGGQDLTSLDIREVRQQVGVVLQTSRLLPTDIFRNIVGSSNLGIDAAWEAARMAGLDRDIKQMPMGMHTVVSEGGGTFSGGQRQRLMIARALIRKPRIIFFDEATSALDNETQSIVTESLESLQATRMVIAHRLSTIINADRIIVLHNGEVQQEGQYEELLRQEGPFAELAQRQIA